jgi:hypothetical protein
MELNKGASHDQLYFFLTDECNEEGFSGRGFSRIFCSMYPAIFYSSNPFPFISLLLLLYFFVLCILANSTRFLFSVMLQFVLKGLLLLLLLLS